MPESVVKTFDLYNTTFYWSVFNDYPDGNYWDSPEWEYSDVMSVAKAYYATDYSSNVIGHQVDFFNTLAGITTVGADSTLNFDLRLTQSLAGTDLLWGKYWWDELYFYANPLVRETVFSTAMDTYQYFSDSVGTLYYIDTAVPYNYIMDSLLIPGLASELTSFFVDALGYAAENSVNVDEVAASTPDADTQYVYDAGPGLRTYINDSFEFLSGLLPFNNIFGGNLITPIEWSVDIPYEGTEYTLNVNFNNNATSAPVQLNFENLKAN